MIDDKYRCNICGRTGMLQKHHLEAYEKLGIFELPKRVSELRQADKETDMQACLTMHQQETTTWKNWRGSC